MKRSVRFFVLFTSIVLIMIGCSVRKEQISTPSFAEKKGRVTAFVNVNLIPMTEEKATLKEMLFMWGIIVPIACLGGWYIFFRLILTTKELLWDTKLY